jgi:hypothetical protein
MEITSKSITDKCYKSLSIQVALDGLSFCSRNTLSNEIITFKKIDFNSYPSSFSIENALWKTLLDYKELTSIYDEIVVLHENNLNTFVPSALFDEEYKGSYLQYNTKVFETDFFTFDALKKQEMVNVYVPYVNITNYLIDQYGTFEYHHYSSILVAKLLERTKNDESQQMFVHVASSHFEIVVIQNQKLLLYNSFEYQNAEDFIYYILFTAEQLHLNPESFKLHLLGDCSIESLLYQKAFQYVRNTSLLDVSELQKTNSFSEQENRTHFILFSS